MGERASERTNEKFKHESERENCRTHRDKFRMVIDRKINYYLQLYMLTFGVIFFYGSGAKIHFRLAIFTMRIQFNLIDYFLFHRCFVLLLSCITRGINARMNSKCLHPDCVYKCV